MRCWFAKERRRSGDGLSVILSGGRCSGGTAFLITDLHSCIRESVTLDLAV